MTEKKRKSFKEIKENADKTKTEMKNTSNKDASGLDKLKRKVNKDLEIDRSNLKDELANNGNRYHRYLELLLNEKKDLSKLKKLQKQLNQKLFHKYKFENNYKLKTSSEVGIYIDGNPKMAQLNEMINNSEGTIEYLEKVLDLFKMRNYALKNIIDVIKLESGLFI